VQPRRGNYRIAVNKRYGSHLCGALRDGSHVPPASW